MWRGGRVTRASSSLGSNLANNASARKNGNVVGVVAGVTSAAGKTNPEKAPHPWGTALSTKGLFGFFFFTRKPLAGYGPRIGFIDSRIHGLF
jgi:hypothetical protein